MLLAVVFGRSVTVARTQAYSIAHTVAACRLVARWESNPRPCTRDNNNGKIVVLTTICKSGARTDQLQILTFYSVHRLADLCIRWTTSYFHCFPTCLHLFIKLQLVELGCHHAQRTTRLPLHLDLTSCLHCSCFWGSENASWVTFACAALSPADLLMDWNCSKISLLSRRAYFYWPKLENRHTNIAA